MANFPGTNIPLSSFKGSESKKEELIARLEQDMANDDIQGMNDAIFSVAYHSVGGQGQGQGNANVSKIHNGTWEVTADVGANTTWAEDNVNSQGDGYIQKGGKKKGKTVEFNNTSGVLVDGVSTGSWGGWDNTEFNRDTGERNVYFKDDPKVDLPTSGTEVDTSVYTTGVTTGNPDWITTGYDPKFVDSKWTPTESGAAGSANLLDYRPWTKNYWKENIAPDAQGLLYMNKPQRDYGLAYLPGEMRDPVNWAAGAGAGGTGHIPGGGWRFSDKRYTTQTNPATGKPYAAGKQPHAPWRFTSGDAQSTNIYSSPPVINPVTGAVTPGGNPWNATSMNLTPAQGTAWQGLLGNLGDTPTINTTTKSLLGV